MSGSWRGIPRRYHGTHAAGRRYLGETRGFLIIATANDALPLVLAHVFPPLESFFRPKVENREGDSGFFFSFFDQSEVWNFWGKAIFMLYLTGIILFWDSFLRIDLTCA